MTDLVALWSSAAFQQDLTGWVDGVLAQRGQRRDGALTEVKVRFWSAVFRVPLTEGTCAYAKVGNPGQSFEGELLQALGRIAPGRVVEPWAFSEAGWWLLPDGGPTLAPGRHPACQLIADVAVLQRICVGRQAALPILPTLPTNAAVPAAERLVAELEGAEGAQRLTAEEAESCCRGLDDFAAAMATLQAAGVPDTVQPNDAHVGNAVGPTTPGGPCRLFDVGDALWSHPWPVLSWAVRSANGCGLTDPWPDTDLTRSMVDAYATHWPEADVHDYLPALDRLGSLHRAVSFHRLLRHADGAARTQVRTAAFLVHALSCAPPT